MSDLESRVKKLEERVDELESRLNGASGKEIEKQTSINEFKQEYEYNSYADKAVLIAYYAEKYEGVTEMSSADFLDWFKKCKWDAPSNPTGTISDAASRHGYFTVVEEDGQTKFWMLTETGEEYVENELKRDSE